MKDILLLKRQSKISSNSSNSSTVSSSIQLKQRFFIESNMEEKSNTDNNNTLITDDLKFFKENAGRCIRNAYSVEHMRKRSDTGELTTSLPEDVMSLLKAETNVLYDLLHGSEFAGTRLLLSFFIDGICSLLQTLQETQTSHRMLFWTTFFDSCAAANDFYRLADNIETYITEIQEDAKFQFGSELNDVLIQQLQDSANIIIQNLTQDAVTSAERTQTFIIRHVQSNTSIQNDYFTLAWEDEWTSNDVTIKLIEIFEDYLTRAKRYLTTDYLYAKAVAISAKAMTCFYVRCLIRKADMVARKQKNRERIFFLKKDQHPFNNHDRALRRISDDIKIMKEFFQEKCNNNSTLIRLVSDDIWILELILECLRSEDVTTLESFIVVLHKRTGADQLVTRYLVGDLWILSQADNKNKKEMHETVKSLEPDLKMVTTRMNEQSNDNKKKMEEITFVRIDDMLKTLYEDRVAQGILPVCWTCLPKIEIDDESDEVVVIEKVRNITRKVADLKIKKPKIIGHNIKKIGINNKQKTEEEQS